jgi:hypothetical protein
MSNKTKGQIKKDSYLASMPGTRIFLLGAGFSQPAGLPLADELLPNVLAVARANFRADGFSHLEHAVKRFRKYQVRTNGNKRFNFERFGEWLDWEHTLRMEGSDTWSEYGSRASLQLRWAIGKVVHESTPETLPDFYYDFARRLTPYDSILTLNYDLVMEKALEEAGVPFRRFPTRYESVGDAYNVVDLDHPQEMRIHKLHGSVDWTYHEAAQRNQSLGTHPLVEGTRSADDPLLGIAVINREDLNYYYSTRAHWSSTPPLLLYPSKAKPLAGSQLIPIWDGIGTHGSWLSGFSIIGCSFPKGDPYVIQLADQIAFAYAAGRRGEAGFPWAHRKMQVVNRVASNRELRRFKNRYSFLNEKHSRFILGGFTSGSIDKIFGKKSRQINN